MPYANENFEPEVYLSQNGHLNGSQATEDHLETNEPQSVEDGVENLKFPELAPMFERIKKLGATGRVMSFIQTQLEKAKKDVGMDLVEHLVRQYENYGSDYLNELNNDLEAANSQRKYVEN